MRSAGLIFLTLAASACAREAEPQRTPPAQPSRPASESGPAALALAPIGGTGPVDLELARLQAIAARQRDEADHWIRLGRAFVQKARQTSDPGFYLSADACAELALERKPRYPLALSLRGMVLLNSHRFRDARDLALATLDQDNDDLMALSVLADALLELGDVRGAEDTTDRMMSLKPTLPAYARAAYLRWLRGDLQNAKHLYRQAIDSGLGAKDREPTAWAMTEASMMFLHAGDYGGALFGFERALEHFADYPQALAGKARALIALGRYDEAARAARRAFEVASLAEAAWLWGDAARALGRIEEAEKAYAEVERVGRWDTHTLAAFYATEGKNLDEAIRLAAKELDARGGIYMHDTYAWALHRAGRHAEAKAQIELATRFGTKDALLLYHAGAIAIANGDTEAGLARVKEALAISPRFQLTGAREASALIQANRAQQAQR